jgi:hypothetical protein
MCDGVGEMSERVRKNKFAFVGACICACRRARSGTYPRERQASQKDLMFSRIGKGIVDFDTFGMVPGCSTHVHVHIYTHASTSSSEAREHVQNKERGRKGERVGTRQGRRQKDDSGPETER